MTLGVAARDSHDLAVVFIAQVFVFVNQSLPHSRSMFLIHAKENGLLEAISAFLEEIGDFLGNELRAVVNDDIAVEVLGVVNAVFDFIAFPVGIPPFWPITLDIQVNMDEDPPRKIYVDGVGATIVVERVEYLDEQGRLVTETLRDFTKQKLKKRFASLDAFLKRWKAAERSG